MNGDQGGWASRPDGGDARTVGGPGPDADRRRKGDRVSFNCKMDPELRRAVRHYATDTDLGVQDVVDAALREYLAARTGGD